MKKTQILIVDDESDLLLEMDKILSREGYEVLAVNDGEAGLAIAAVKNLDLAILDIRMPGMNGLEVCQRLRKSNPGVRIIFLTALKEDVDKVRGLDIGADDYVTKPFNMLELKARIRALLRRSASNSSEKISGFGDVTLDHVRREVTRNGVSVELTAMEFDLLAYFLRHEGAALSRENMIDEMWGHKGSPSDRTIDTHVARLRKKLEKIPHEPQHLLTVHGTGYKFIA